MSGMQICVCSRMHNYSLQSSPTASFQDSPLTRWARSSWHSRSGFVRHSKLTYNVRAQLSMNPPDPLRGSGGDMTLRREVKVQRQRTANAIKIVVIAYWALASYRKIVVNTTLSKILSNTERHGTERHGTVERMRTNPIPIPINFLDDIPDRLVASVLTASRAAYEQCAPYAWDCSRSTEIDKLEMGINVNKRK